MSERISARMLEAAFRDYQRAYARAGLFVTINHEGTKNYEATALDLVLNMPSAYQGGSISVEPWHNPLHPQRWNGASAAWHPVGMEFLGDTKAQAYRTLRAATVTLYAVIKCNGGTTRPRHVEAVEYLDRSIHDLDAL